jgi:hypothetical protein
MPRYVILEHDHPVLHWDLMLECGGVLRTWRLESPPRPGGAVSGTASFDHRLHYLDYEGPVSGDRGCVKRWDLGELTWLAEQDEQVTVSLVGNRLRGLARLRKGAGEKWLVTFDPQMP